METIINVTKPQHGNLHIYLKDEWGKESEITIPGWKAKELAEKLNKVVGVDVTPINLPKPITIFNKVEASTYDTFKEWWEGIIGKIK